MLSSIKLYPVTYNIVGIILFGIVDEPYKDEFINQFYCVKNEAFSTLIFVLTPMV